MAVAQEDDAVRPGRELRLVGHDEAVDVAPRGGAQQAHDGLAVHGVESAGRLVGEEQPAVADDRSGDRNPLTLAAGELVGGVIRMVRDVELLHRLEGRDAVSPRGDAVELERQSDVLDRRQPWEQVEVLEDIADRPASHSRPVGARDLCEVHAVHEHLAAGGRLEAAGDR